MAVDLFAKIGDIKGESNDEKHKGEIELLSWSWGISQSGSMAYGSGGGTGKANFADFGITHYLDKATPNLMKACATGEHIKEATITARKAGKGQQEFWIVKLSDIVITGVHPTGHNGDGGLVENVTLQATKIDVEYKPQKPDGSLDAGVKFGYDVKQNKAV
jgi:type VI secretion system secreted protein Hcp